MPVASSSDCIYDFDQFLYFDGSGVLEQSCIFAGILANGFVYCNYYSADSLCMPDIFVTVGFGRNCRIKNVSGFHLDELGLFDIAVWCFELSMYRAFKKIVGEENGK